MSGSKSSAPAADAEPLSFTVHGVAVPDLADERPVDPRRVRLGRLKMLAVLLVCAAPVLASYFTYFVIRPEGRTNYAELVLPPVDLPAALPLRDLQDAPVAAATLRGQWLLVAVSGGACAATCEQHLLLQRQLREALGRDKDRLDKVWLVTDDATIRPDLRDAVTAGVATTVLRVDAAALASWLRPATGRALSDHLYLVDPMGNWMMRTPIEPDGRRLKRDIERLLRASSSWDQAGR
jgi:hypothetical protein